MNKSSRYGSSTKVAWLGNYSLECGRQLVSTFHPLPGDESVVSILCGGCRATTFGRIRSRQFFLCHELLLPAVNTQLTGHHSVLLRLSDDTDRPGRMLLLSTYARKDALLEIVFLSECLF